MATEIGYVPQGMGIEGNAEMELAWRLITSTNMSVFLTGKAGTGKTTFLRRLKELAPKRMVVLAPTGVAAINAHGQTIHSFFQLPMGPNVPDAPRERRNSFKMSEEKKSIIRTLDLLVIDEISMVRCDLLDAIDTELRRFKKRYLPFGGVQLLMIGDLQQLPPVAKEQEWALLSPHYPTPYFFSSKALQQTPFTTIELKRIYRQQDATFIGILAKIRANRLDAQALALLNSRYQPTLAANSDGDQPIRLTTHNRTADDYNRQMLDALPGPISHFNAKVKGVFPETSFPADSDMELKPSARVMFIKNDISGKGEYYNGKIGVVTAISDDCTSVTVRCAEDGSEITIGAVTWDNTRYVLNDETQEIEESVEGTFSQLPLRLAWAITIHKSQGLTFDRAVLDVNASFAHGQTYVALSRCRSLEGVTLSRPLSPSAVITDVTVDEFMRKALEASADIVARMGGMARDYYLELLNELFSFDTIERELAYVQRIVDEHLFSAYPEWLATLTEAQEQCRRQLTDVSRRFATQYQAMAQSAADPEHDPTLNSRIAAAIPYFLKTLRDVFASVVVRQRMSIGNKQIAKQYVNAMNTLRASIERKASLLSRLADEQFSVKGYLKANARASLNSPSAPAKTMVVSDVPRQKATTAKAGKAWSRDDDQLLLKMYNQGVKPRTLADTFGRTTSAIKSRIRKLLDNL